MWGGSGGGRIERKLRREVCGGKAGAGAGRGLLLWSPTTATVSGMVNVIGRWCSDVAAADGGQLWFPRTLRAD